MAIAFDAGTYSAAATSTSLTFSHTCTGSSRILFVMGHDKQTSATVVTGVTYGGAAMTQVNTLAGSATQNDRAITLWYLVNPASGANNVVVSASESVSLRFHAVSYTGARQISQPDGSDTSTGNGVATISTDITTTADNCWMLMFGKDDVHTYTSTTGDTMRLASDAAGHFIADTGAAITPAGANTMTIQPNTGSIVVGALAVSFSPVQSATIVDTVKVGDSLTVGRILSSTIVDIVKVGDVVSAIRRLTATVVDTVKVGDIIAGVTAVWTRLAKNLITWVNKTRLNFLLKEDGGKVLKEDSGKVLLEDSSTVNYNNQSKSSYNFTNQNKS